MKPTKRPSFSDRLREHAAVTTDERTFDLLLRLLIDTLDAALHHDVRARHLATLGAGSRNHDGIRDLQGAGGSSPSALTTD
eukprot:scaffold1228_cov246-Pinguiococcus_pyrenoidosus.AAC.24